MVRADNEHAKSSFAPPSHYNATLCATKVYTGTELHCIIITVHMFIISYHIDGAQCDVVSLNA